MYAFIGVDKSRFPNFSDQSFALDLLEKKHVLVAPGTSFNTRDANFFRITNLPDAETLREVFTRIHDLLESHAAEQAA
jgi:alanine-synthesizing transaminase